MDLKSALCFILALVHVTNSFPAHGDPSPCNEFLGDDYSDVILYCDEPATSLDQIKEALNAIEGQGSIGLELYQVNLGTVPSDFFKGHNIKVLTIAFCQVESLAAGGDRPFEGLEDTLEVLIIKGSLMDKSSAEMSSLGHLKKLKELQLISNSIREIDNGWFQEFSPFLQTVVLTENGIEKLGQGVFSSLRELQYISLNGNTFGQVTRSMFPMPSKLRRIELENNNLLELPANIFSQMPELEAVSLASNSLSHIKKETWRPVWSQLKDINLSDNPIECDSHLKWLSEIPTCAKISATCKDTNAEFPSTVNDTNCD